MCENGRSYYPLHGQKIEVSARIFEKPNLDLLRCHNEAVYLG